LHCSSPHDRDNSVLVQSHATFLLLNKLLSTESQRQLARVLLLVPLQGKKKKRRRTNMSKDLFRKRPRPASIARTTSRRDMSCDIINEIIHENSKLNATEGASKAGKNVSLEEINTSLKEEEITKPLDFLHYCGVCRRLLGSECDIFIYRFEFNY
jgi:zinc-finger of the FCS-type, C2-C2